MSLNIVTKRLAPLPVYNGALSCVPVEALPFVLSALDLRAQKYWWLEPEDQKTGRRLMYLVSIMLLKGCGDEIVTAINQVYRLLDASINGVTYTFTGDGTPDNPYIYNPIIGIVPTVGEADEPGQRFYLAKAMRLLDNLVNATTYTDAPDARNIRQQLDDIIAALEAEDFDPATIEALLGQIALLLA
jgi:hypothetical protein